jgi:hypothetical protein
MKKCVALIFVACMTMALVSQASAIEVQVGGVMDYVVGINKNTDFKDTESEDTIVAVQRSRIAVEFIADENLRGVIQFQFGASNWGNRDEGASLDTTNSNALTRRAYLDWSIANTPLTLKVGLQEIALPSATAGNPVFGSNAAGIVAAVQPSDPFTLTGFWARAFHSATDFNGDRVTHNNDTDVFGLIADISLEKVSISPWATVALIGGNSVPFEADWDYYNRFGGVDDE